MGSKKIHYQAPSFKLTRRNGDKSTMKIQLYIGLAIVLWAASESEAAASMERYGPALGDLIPLTKGNRIRRGWGAACLPSGSACGGYGTTLTSAHKRWDVIHHTARREKFTSFNEIQRCYEQLSHIATLSCYLEMKLI